MVSPDQDRSRKSQTTIRRSESHEKICQHSSASERNRNGAISVDELIQSEIGILQSPQQSHYAPKIKTLQNLLGSKSRFEDRKDARESNRQVKQTSTLYRLDPFIDLLGILRVGGRILYAEQCEHPFRMMLSIL
jgi:hypothetical protein